MSDDPSRDVVQSSLLDLPARSLISRVADPSHNSGGGVIAGLTLAGAAASAELVLRLAARRKSLADRKEQIEKLLNDVVAHRISFENAADRDIAAFTELVNTQREAKKLRDEDPAAADASLRSAYVHAAQVPLALSREAIEFMEEVQSSLGFASRFTISDLGAAAALARGATDAALLTVEANLAYIDDDLASPLRDEARMIRERAGKIADDVIEHASDTISGHTKGS